MDKANSDIDIKHRGKFKSLTDEDKKDLKRRQAIGPIIGHLKADRRMNRYHLKGLLGGSLHTVLCAAVFNIRCLLRMILKKGISFFASAFVLRFGENWSSIASDFYQQVVQVRRNAFGVSAKINFKGRLNEK